ncbi:hypothetical protein DNU06_05885 [Putridiphycobacter roseus]|uniref:RiboL-PSP-HEPN domain-containing protein n=1 Tax=Putridiphycobacter roseus TaxID=2219161 RepID=A0A2W1NJL1_9FLAO|nr:MAE_28990/MAE_18760 family HEPN-like nuclease [Putridiphycobacter roseus]PZE18146.1 hypothetical protein DNU06_05885 [Putridiphycobacter roseus]
MASIDTIKINFHSVISEIKGCVDYYSNKGEVTNAIKSSLRNDEGVRYHKSVIEDKFIKVKFSSDIYYNSFFVLLCASYENFLTETLKESLNRLSVCKNKSLIPEKLKRMNTKFSGSLLTTLDKKPSHLKIDYNEIIENLNKGIDGKGEYQFNKEIVFYVKGILKLESFIDFLDKFDLELKIDKFANTEEFKSYFKERNRESERVLEIENKHNSIFRIRNNIAHNGRSADVTKEKLIEVLNFLEAFTNGLSNLIDNSIKLKYSE